MRLLGKKGNPRAKEYDFCFKPLLICGECEGTVTAERKQKIIKKTGNVKEYVFYHCTHNKKDAKCQQRSIEEEELEKAMRLEMASYTILPQFKDWAIEMLNKHNDTEIQQRTKIHEMQSNAVLTVQGELDSLTQMRYRNLLDDEEFLRQKKQLKARLAKLEEELGDTKLRAENWLEPTEKTFDWITYVVQNYELEDFEGRRTILQGFGAIFAIRDRKLKMQPHEWLVPIGENYKQLENEYLSLEPAERALQSGESAALDSIRLRWRRERDSNPRGGQAP
ncbi:recombinase zinc beta ribbon domain-containing protein [Candidatus Peregrinibacteria bacterium]|nr:MAG: recombinase zinc beta ribbon domain-containing protein [Candidatus Peregrinibacteria bacterium]